jgi:DNA repair exonuclease SbcCD nuclease subunit
VGKICVLGDIHFRSDGHWSEIAEKFLGWFEGVNLDGTLIQLGDVTDKDMNPGNTVEYVYRFAELCQKKFLKTYVLVGNHDRKLYKGREQYSVKFLNRIEGLEVVDRPRVETIEGLKTLMLPFIRPRGLSCEEYYETKLDPEFYEEVDLLVGHVAAKEKGAMYGGVDLAKFKPKQIALGHIHSRPLHISYREAYTGSIAPFKINEDLPGDLPRVVKVFENSQTSEIEIPKFVSYDEVTYPEKISPPTDDLIHIYTVKECKNLFKAKAFYEGHHIRAVEKKAKIVEVEVGERGKVFETKREAFSSMIKDSKMRVSRPVYKYVLDLLGAE